MLTLASDTCLTITTASVYREIINELEIQGFHRSQYSVFHREGSATNAWTAMLGLREIRPHGIFATVVRRLQMLRVPTPNLLIVTNDVRLGGVYSPTLLGPTPAVLAHGMGVPHAQWPNGAGDRLPFGVRYTPGSTDRNNWRV
jgi:hypothetical protein